MSKNGKTSSRKCTNVRYFLSQTRSRKAKFGILSSGQYVRRFICQTTTGIFICRDERKYSIFASSYSTNVYRSLPSRTQFIRACNESWLLTICKTKTLIWAYTNANNHGLFSFLRSRNQLFSSQKLFVDVALNWKTLRSFQGRHVWTLSFTLGSYSISGIYGRNYNKSYCSYS